jgi:hypothetical protein
MRLLSLALSLIVVFAVIVQAKVTPVVLEEPLSLRGESIERTAEAMDNSSRLLDDWLNIRINSDITGQVQNEEQIVVNPINPDNVVAVWRDFRLGYRRVGMGRSFDGGFTWEDELFVEPTFPKQSDPGLTYHSSGAIYAVVLSYDPSGSGDALMVSETMDGGLTWGTWYPAVINYDSDIFEDKELMVCDRSGSSYDGNLYVSWTRFVYNPNTETTITLVRSTDGGVSWDDPVAVSDDHGVQWSVPAVGPDGQVYLAWVKYYDDEIRFDRSFDGGVTWGDDITVQQTGFASGYINPDLLIFAFPAMDVDITNGPNRGNIYIAYTDDPNGDTDIFLTRSRNQGDTWTTPIRVNDDEIGNGADQFHPWLVCDENGILHLIFYDRRNDVPQNLLMDLYYTYSNDGGLTWSPNERITTVSSNPALDSLDSGLIGEYNGLAVFDGVIHPIWTDTRNGHQDAFTAVWDTTVTVPPVQEDPFAGTQFNFRVDCSPNPFNNTTAFHFQLERSEFVELTVYDLLGRNVANLVNGRLSAGAHRIEWRADGLPSGLYLIRIQAGTEVQVIKAMLLE